MEINGNSQFAIAKRLDDFIEYDAITTPSQFAAKAGIDASGFHKMLKGQLKITTATLKKISDSYGINMTWLTTGEGEMYVRKDESTKVGSGFEIPLLDLDASAGFSMVDVIGDNSRRMLTLPKCDGAITIVGKSMEPTIHDGDIGVFDMVNSPSSIRPDGIYIVQYADEEGDTHLTVKRVKRSPEGNAFIRLSADNPEYGYEDVPLERIVRVAKVLYTINKLSY